VLRMVCLKTSYQLRFTVVKNKSAMRGTQILTVNDPNFLTFVKQFIPRNFLWMKLISQAIRVNFFIYTYPFFKVNLTNAFATKRRFFFPYRYIKTMFAYALIFSETFYIIMKSKFKQWWPTIPPIAAAKRTITPHL
jgi:hypothetical protein